MSLRTRWASVMALSVGDRVELGFAVWTIVDLEGDVLDGAPIVKALLERRPGSGWARYERTRRVWEPHEKVRLVEYAHAA